MRKLVLFDIDGTLIDSGDASVIALTSVFRDLYDIANAFISVRMDGKTDKQIIKEGLAANNLPIDDDDIPPIIADYLIKLKKEINLPVTTVGSIMNLDNAEKILSDGHADFIALARPMIADPEIIRKAAFGKQDDIRPCIRCNYCASSDSPVRCSVNPIAGRGVEFPTEEAIAPARKKKKVLVAGG